MNASRYGMNVAMVMIHGNGEGILQSQIDPLRSTAGSELTLKLRNLWQRNSVYSSLGQWPAVFIFTEILGKWKIGNNRSEIAMFTTKILIGVLRVFAL